MVLSRFVNRSRLRIILRWSILGIFIADSLSARAVTPFGVRDDIELAQFADVIPSPSHKLVIVHQYRVAVCLPPD